MPRGPNFLVFVTDQQRSDHTGFGGNAVLRTPNLDRLAARGMRFDRAIVANPICMPNRATLFTGRHPAIHGVRYNGTIPSRRPGATSTSTIRRRFRCPRPSATTS